MIGWDGGIVIAAGRLGGPDICYIFNNNGYYGKSVCMYVCVLLDPEVGF